MRSCLVPRYRSVVWTLAWPRIIWICSSSAPAARQSLAQVRRASCGAMPATPAAFAYGLSICHTTFSESASPCIRPLRLTGRKMKPSTTPAGPVQASIATFTQAGIGTVRTRLCLPTRSTMHHRPSRCWMWPIVSAATSDRRSAQPSSTTMMARSRRPLIVVISGTLRSACACFKRQPVPHPHADGFRALHPLDAGGQFRRQQAVVGGLHGQLADGRHADDDRGGPQPAFLQGYAPGGYGGLGEARPRLLGVPGEKLI